MEDCPGGCRLAIVGSRDVPDTPAIRTLIRAIINKHKPIVIISGDAIGIDAYALSEGLTLGIPTKSLHIADFKKPMVQGLNAFVNSGARARNLAIVDDAECVVRIASLTTKTYGSGWTADTAEAVGRRVWRTTVKAEM